MRVNKHTASSIRIVVLLITASLLAAWAATLGLALHRQHAYVSSTQLWLHRSNVGGFGPLAQVQTDQAGNSNGPAQWPNAAPAKQQQQMLHTQSTPALNAAAVLTHLTDRKAVDLHGLRSSSSSSSSSTTQHTSTAPSNSSSSARGVGSAEPPANLPHSQTSLGQQPAANLHQEAAVHRQAQWPPLPKPVYVGANVSALQAQAERSKGPVDIVYLWVNGTGPQLQQELAQLQPSSVSQAQKAGTGLENPAKQSRFDAGRDELRYSLRSVEIYLPWINHIYIVTNGQVPNWLDVKNQNITVVPHCSIFPNASHLPTFNSMAIQANLANIPGLGEAFILMDDDWLLTAPWQMGDFVAPDGGQVLTGSSPADDIRPGSNIYLTNVHKTFTQRFGPWPRYDPSHSPHYMQLHWLNKLVQELPELFTTTSAQHFRTPKDLQIASAYQWFVSQHQPGTHATLPDAHASFMPITARSFLTAAVDDLRDRQRRDDRMAAALLASAEYLTGGFAKQAQLAAQAAMDQPGSGLGAGLTAQVRSLNHTLHQAWRKPGAKTVCLQDDANDAFGAARQLIDPVVKAFLASRYPTPSQFELPGGASNGCRHRLPQTQFGQLPTASDFKAAYGLED